MHINYNKYVRTTLNIPESLISEAKQLLNYQSKTDVVIYALKELIRRIKADELINLAGIIKLELDINKFREKK